MYISKFVIRAQRQSDVRLSGMLFFVRSLYTNGKKNLLSNHTAKRSFQFCSVGNMYGIQHAENPDHEWTEFETRTTRY